MSIRKVYIDGDVAEEAENLSKYLGYKDLEHYVMSLILSDLDEKKDMIRLIHSMIDDREDERE